MSAPFLELVPLAVLGASLLGSPHCVVMCGPLVLAMHTSRTQLWMYQTGRLFGYLGAGVAAGSLGDAVLVADSNSTAILGLSVIASVLLFTGYRTVMGKTLHMAWPGFMTRASFKLWRRLQGAALPRPLFSGLAGIMTILLPCGHLYGFVAGAAATGSGLRGGLFMFMFWLGTVPATSLGAFKLLGLLQRSKSPRLAGLLLIMAGIFSLLAFASNLEFGPAKKPHTESLMCL